MKPKGEGFEYHLLPWDYIAVMIIGGRGIIDSRILNRNIKINAKETVKAVV